MARSSVPRVQAVPDPRPHGSLQRPTVLGRYLNSALNLVGASWRPALREPMDDTLESWVDMAARAIESLHSSGLLAGAIDQAVGQMVGVDLQLNLRPQIGILGNEDETEDWARLTEMRFEDWCNDPWSCDLTGQYTLGQQAAQGVRQMYATGEQIALFPFQEREGSSHGTKVSIIPSSRLSQMTGYVYSQPEPFNRAIQGVLIAADSTPRGYVFEERDPTNSRIEQRVVRARDATGRPAVLHLFDNMGARRGITPLAPVIKVLRQWDQLQNATLTAAMVQALFAATVESPAPTSEILKALQNEEEQAATTEMGTGPTPGDFANYLEMRTEWYKNTKIDLGEYGKIVHLFAGEKLNFNRSEHPNTTYEAFAKSLHREIARCIGVIYPQFSGDYVGETYTSLRMAISDMWILNLIRRAYFPARFMRTAFECWLEEDIERGLTPFPGGVAAFRIQKNAVCRSDWRGPTRPTADDLKTAKAQQIQRQEGWMPTEALAAEYEQDHRDVIESQARTNKLRKDNDLPELPGGSPLGGGSFGQGGEPNPGAAEDNPAAAKERDNKLVSALMENDHAAVESLLLEERLTR
jgi:lambda family phage portal protein